jgi:DDE superfamily endonuclease
MRGDPQGRRRRFGDKGFIGTDYITTPVRKPQGRELYMREHDYNNQVSSFRAPVERAIANLKTWRILFTDYRRPLERSLPRSGPQSASTSSKRVLHKPHWPNSPS